VSPWCHSSITHNVWIRTGVPGGAWPASWGPGTLTVNAYAPGMIPSGTNTFTQMPSADQDRSLDTLTLRRLTYSSSLS
jgi:hypothetical protein